MASQLKISDKLVSFAAQSQSDQLADSLDKLAVFHKEFSDDVESYSQNPNFGKSYEDGFADGVAQGRISGKTDGAANHKNTCDLISALQSSLEALGADIQDSHGRAVSGALRAVLPHLAEKAAGAEITAFISQISGQALRGKVALVVNPKFETELEGVLETLNQASYETPQFSIKTDETLTDGAIKAVWSSGGGDIDIDAAVHKCLALLSDT